MVRGVASSNLHRPDLIIAGRETFPRLQTGPSIMVRARGIGWGQPLVPSLSRGICSRRLRYGRRMECGKAHGCGTYDIDIPSDGRGGSGGRRPEGGLPTRKAAEAALARGSRPRRAGRSGGCWLPLRTGDDLGDRSVGVWRRRRPGPAWTNDWGLARPRRSSALWNGSVQSQAPGAQVSGLGVVVSPRGVRHAVKMHWSLPALAGTLVDTDRGRSLHQTAAGE